MHIVLYLALSFTAKVTISPADSPLMLLSYNSRNAKENLFDFQTVYRQDASLLHCTSPVLAPINENKYRIYFCGNLMHVAEDRLEVISVLENSSIFEFVPHEDKFMIKGANRCLQASKKSILLVKCDEDNKMQNFVVKRVKKPVGENFDLTEKQRSSEDENRDLIYDDVMRRFSSIKHNEYVFDSVKQYSLD